MIIIYSVVQPTLSISLRCFPAMSFAGVIWGSWHMAQSIYTQFVDIAITFTFNPLHDTRANVIIHCMEYATFTCFILNQLNGVHGCFIGKSCGTHNARTFRLRGHSTHTAQPTQHQPLGNTIVCVFIIIILLVSAVVQKV